MTSGDTSSFEQPGYRRAGQHNPDAPPSSDAGPPREQWPRSDQHQAPGSESHPGPGPYPPSRGSQPGAGGQSHGGWSPGVGGTGQRPLSSEEERTWAMAAHLSSILGVWVFFLGAVGPLVVLLMQGQRSPYVRAQAVEALNFNISVLVYSIIAWILVIVLIGLLALAALFVFQVLFTIIATVKVSGGEPYRYPLTFRMVS